MSKDREEDININAAGCLNLNEINVKIIELKGTTPWSLLKMASNSKIHSSIRRVKMKVVLLCCQVKCCFELIQGHCHQLKGYVRGVVCKRYFVLAESRKSISLLSWTSLVSRVTT
jgi:hypothetical protein